MPWLNRSRGVSCPVLLRAAGLVLALAPVSPVAAAPPWPVVQADAPASQPAVSGTPVGVPGWMRDLVLEGGRLEVLPTTPAAPVVVRIAEVRPHGSAWRYEIEYYGLEPGPFDLGDFLRREDGSSTADLPPLPIVIESSLPPGVIRPGELESTRVPDVGGYTLTLWLAGGAWVVGLVALLSWKRRQDALEQADTARPRTLAERLRPLVERGLAGELSGGESAELELTLIAYWRRKLQLEEHSAADALAQLKTDPAAGPLLRELERWMHSPEPATDVDVSALLVPYRDLPADELELAGAGSSASSPGPA